jgi:hypothetical protein
MGTRAVIGGLLALAAIVAIVVPGGASGDDASKPYPKIMAPAAPGGGWDTTARAFQAASRDAKLDDGTEVRRATAHRRAAPDRARRVHRAQPAGADRVAPPARRHGRRGLNRE